MIMSDLLYQTPLFTDVWNTELAFIDDYRHCKLPTKISEETQSLIYYLLYSRYGNSPIAPTDLNRFKYGVYTTLFQYGETFEKQLEVREKVLALKDEDIQGGSMNVVNHAYNPDTVPATNDLSPLSYINQQTVQGVKKSKVEGYALYLSLLDDRFIEDFLRHFKPLFLSVVSPQTPIVYRDEEEN